MVIFIRRVETGKEGTHGVLYTEGFCCYTLELPWRNNERNVSCVPPGKYTASVDNTTAIGGNVVIRLDDVPNRDGILIHVANKISEIQGCVAVGLTYEENAEKVVGQSRLAMAELLKAIGNTPLLVDIDWV